MNNSETSFLNKDFFGIVGPGIAFLSNATEITKPGSYGGRLITAGKESVAATVSKLVTASTNGIMAMKNTLGSFGDKVLRAVVPCYAARRKKQEENNNQQEEDRKRISELPLPIFSLIASYLPHEKRLTDSCSHSSQLFEVYPSRRSEFVKSAENVIQLFQEYAWNTKRIPLIWLKALEENIRSKKQTADKPLDVLKISSINATPDTMKFIARYIPNVKKLHICHSVVDKTIATLCRTLFPKLEDIWYTHVEEYSAEEDDGTRAWYSMLPTVATLNCS